MLDASAIRQGRRLLPQPRADQSARAAQQFRARQRALPRALRLDDGERAAMVEDGVVAVTCEFCNRAYRFDPADLTGPEAKEQP